MESIREKFNAIPSVKTIFGIPSNDELKENFQRHPNMGSCALYTKKVMYDSVRGGAGLGFVYGFCTGILFTRPLQLVPVTSYTAACTLACTCFFSMFGVGVSTYNCIKKGFTA